MNRRHLLQRLSTTAVLAALSQGCLLIPTPGLKADDARQNLGDEIETRFSPGKTRRSDILLALGEPDAITADERRMAYRSRKIAALVVVGGYGSAAVAPLTKDDYLVFEFDTSGRLHRTRRSSHWLNNAGLEETLGSPISQPPANTRIDTRASFLAGTRDYRKLTQGTGTWQEGRIRLTDTTLHFHALQDPGNAPPTLSLSFRDITGVSAVSFLVGHMLGIDTRDGRHLAFLIRGDSRHWISRQKLDEVLTYLREKTHDQKSPTTPRR